MEKPPPNFSSDSYLPFSGVSTSELKEQFSSDKSKGKLSNKFKKYLSIERPVPWKNRESYSSGVIGLHEEIEDFYEMMKPTEEENEVRLKVIEHVTNIIHSMWPYAQVEVFGSFRTGMYLPHSDIDMVVIGEWRGLPLRTLSKALELRGISKNDISIIDNARVPLVKFVHTPTKIKVDISFNKNNGVESAKLVKKMIKKYPTLPKLLLVLKQFLAHRGLNEVYNGGMSSYCITLLLVSFLQGIYKPKTLPSSNLGTLLLEFFELYGVNFNYERVSIHLNEGGNYQPKYERRGTALSIEDPLEKGNNVAKGTFLMHILKIAFENAFHILHKAVTESAESNQPLNSYLNLIIGVDNSVLDERKWLHQNYSSILQQLSDFMKMYQTGQIETERPSTSNICQPKKKKMR